MFSQLISNFTLSDSLFVLSFLTLVVGALIDIKDGEVDWRIFAIGILLGLLYSIANQQNYLLMIYAVISAAIIPAILVLFSKGKWMGAGDIFFAAIAGLLAGFPGAIVAIFVAFLAAAVFGIIYSYVKPKAKELPLGPFITFGCIIAVVLGQSIIYFFI